MSGNDVELSKCVQARRNIFFRRCCCHLCCFFALYCFSLDRNFLSRAISLSRQVGMYAVTFADCCCVSACGIRAMGSVASKLFSHMYECALCMCAVYHFFCSYSCTCLLLAQFGFGIAIVNSLCQTGGKV